MPPSVRNYMCLGFSLAELQSRPSLLGACTSFPVLMEKLMNCVLVLFRLRLI
jgi:hypothetical protein